MAEEVEIHDLVEKAILSSFDRMGNKALQRKIIVKAVREYTDKDEAIIKKRIEKMMKKNYLIKKSRGIYERNQEMAFRLGDSLSPIVEAKSIPIEIRKIHTEDLKEVIKLWIKYFPMPYFNCGCLMQDMNFNFKNCEQHLLFQDLKNHLPHINGICEEWSRYKSEMENLERIKKGLFNSLEARISKCFEGLNLEFAPCLGYACYGYNIGEFGDPPKCDAIPSYVYFYILESQLEGMARSSLLRELGASQIMNDPDSEDEFDYTPYSEYYASISSYQSLGLPRYEIFRYLGYDGKEAPKEICDKLDKAQITFLEFFFTIGDTEFMDLGKDIVEKVNLLNQKRNNIIKKLERIMFYPSFPGECEYLQVG